MVKFKLKRKKGLTLLELVIVLGLMSIVTMLIFSFTNTTQRKSKELEIRQELQHEGTMITESFMGNILQAEGVAKIELRPQNHTNPIDRNIIKSIEFKVTNGELKNKPTINRISGIIFEQENNILKLKVRRDHDDNSGTDDIIENIQDVTEYMKLNDSGIIEGIEVLNPEIKTEILTTTLDTIETDKLKKIKNINLKIILEKEYYNKTIEHEHIMELNLRNAN